MKHLVFQLCACIFFTAILLTLPIRQAYAIDYAASILQSILQLFNTPGHVIKEPQVRGWGGYDYKTLNYGSADHPKQDISGALNGSSFSWQHTLPTLSNIQQGIELRDGCLSLLSNTLQQQTKWPSGATNPINKKSYYHITANHKLVFYDNNGGDCHIPDSGTPTSLNDYGWESVYPASELCWAVLSNGSLSPDKLNFPVSLPDESVSLFNGSCTNPDPGKPIGTFPDGDASTEYYTGGDATDFPLSHFFSAAQVAALAAKCIVTYSEKTHSYSKTCPDLTADVSSNIILSTRNPGAENVALWTGKGPNGEKEGFTYSLIPSVFNLSNEHGIFEGFLDVETSVARGVSFGGKVDIPKAVYAYEYGRRQHIDAFNCALTPQQQIPVTKGGDPECQFPTNSTVSTALDVCGVAAKYGIPCCMLRGEMEVETSSGTTMGSGSCTTGGKTFNCCNGDQCGPAQVTCSQYSAWAGNDNIDMCSQAGAAELLARAMHLKLCYANGTCKVGTWVPDGTKAMSVPIPNDTSSLDSYTALGYFYGTQGCILDSCTQYRWGTGKTYCDAIKNFCENGQILPDNTTQNYCLACSEETKNAGQGTINCKAQ